VNNALKQVKISLIGLLWGAFFLFHAPIW